MKKLILILIMVVATSCVNVEPHVDIPESTEEKINERIDSLPRINIDSVSNVFERTFKRRENDSTR